MVRAQLLTTLQTRQTGHVVVVVSVVRPSPWQRGRGTVFVVLGNVVVTWQRGGGAKRRHAVRASRLSQHHR